MSQVETGAKLILTINNVPVAYASEVSYSLLHDVHNIKVIDQKEIAEFAEVGIMVNFTASYFRVANDSCIKNGWMPKLSNLLRQPEIVATIKSKISNKTLMTIAGLKCISRSGNVGARTVMTETLTFIGKKLYDEEGR